MAQSGRKHLIGDGLTYRNALHMHISTRLLLFILIITVRSLSACLFDLLFNLFRIALWPSIGKELSPWLFTCAGFILVPS